MDCKLLNVKLPSGNQLPLIGLGTYQIHGRQLIREILDIALSAGYRSIDTAEVYGNERDIGVALKELLPKYKLKREDIFITTKLSPSHHGDSVPTALSNSLTNLNCNYIDLYLVHWPGQSGVSVKDSRNAEVRVKTWQHLVEAKKQGLVRDIGVSNYTADHLDELFANSFGEKPAVNQVEWHPHYHQSELKKLCKKEGILLQAYSSLGGSHNFNLISDPVIVNIAHGLNKEPAQVLLRWALQQKIAIIPKGTSRKHIEANIDLNFVIPEKEMATLSSLQTRKKYAWDPSTVVIAEVSLQHFNNLPKSRKPSENEWTVLSCIIKEDVNANCLEVVALGTGSKCIGSSKMSATGDILNDSHGEVICRRSFLRYLFCEIEICLCNRSSIFLFNSDLKKFELKSNVLFHFFTTQVPCGDAAIFPKNINSDDVGKCPLLRDVVDSEDDSISEGKCKKRKLDVTQNTLDIFRTGAKSLPNDETKDLHLIGAGYHTIGLIRTKPGRGSPTLSVSCSDKVAKWCYLGIQGALLSLLLVKPIYLSSMTLAGNTPYSEEALNRALYKRFADIDLKFPYQRQKMALRQAKVNFQFCKSEGKLPCPSSVIWSKDNTNSVEVAINGKKQGTTKKKFSSPTSRVKICKIELFKRFIELVVTYKLFSLDFNLSKKKYCEVKQMAVDYQDAWKILRCSVFRIWTVKNSVLLYFTCDS